MTQRKDGKVVTGKGTYILIGIYPIMMLLFISLQIGHHSSCSLLQRSRNTSVPSYEIRIMKLHMETTTTLNFCWSKVHFCHICDHFTHPYVKRYLFFTSFSGFLPIALYWIHLNPFTYSPNSHFTSIWYMAGVIFGP